MVPSQTWDAQARKTEACPAGRKRKEEEGLGKQARKRQKEVDSLFTSRIACCWVV